MSPNIDAAISAVTYLIDLCREANKALSKVAASFFNLSSAETAPLETAIFSQMNKTISVSLPIMESVTERLRDEIYKPFQFLEVDTMKIFRHMLQSVQQRSLDCVKSRRKSEKYLKVHAATVNEWVAFRRTRHEMLIEKSLVFAQNMAAEVRVRCLPLEGRYVIVLLLPCL